MVLANSSVAANASAAATDGQGKRASTFNGAIRSPAREQFFYIQELFFGLRLRYRPVSARFPPEVPHVRGWSDFLAEIRESA
jgi:hypothetical protein